MPFRLKSKEAFPDGIRRIADEQIQWAADQLSTQHHVEQDVDRGVHEARKSIKKVRGILRLIQPDWRSGYRAENGRFRTLARALSAARDAAVLLETFDSAAGRRAREFSAIRQGLEKQLHQSKRAADLPVVLRETAEGLRAAARRVENWPVPNDGEAGFAATYERGKKALELAIEDPTPENLHSFRKRVKEHRYHSRLVGNKAREENLHGLETILGDNQNLAVLHKKLDESPADYGDPLDLSAFLALLIRKQHSLERRALSLGRRLYRLEGIRDAEWPNTRAAAIRHLRGDRSPAAARAVRHQSG